MATPGLLIINEPSIGLTDRSGYLHIGDGPEGIGGDSHTAFRNMLNQRGTASIALRMLAGDNYQPTVGSSIYLYDVNVGGQGFPLFAGTIDSIETSWWGKKGDRLVALNCVSFEQCFDVVRLYPQLFTGLTSDQVFTILFNLVGTPQPWLADQAYIPGFQILDPSGHSQLCITGGTSGGTAPTWNDTGGTTTEGGGLAPNILTWQDLGIVNKAPVTLQTFFQAPGIQPGVAISQWFASDFETIKDGLDNLAKLTQFVWGISLSAAGNTAQNVTTPTGLILLTNWRGLWNASTYYATGATLLDSNFHIQQVTVPGVSGSIAPAWSMIGGFVVDGAVHWTDMGAQNAAYFAQPSTFPTPNPPWSTSGQLGQGDFLYDQISIKSERHDYRNRQYIKMATGTLQGSQETFKGVGQTSFTMKRAVASMTGAWLTYNTQNCATATFTGQPSPGDTLVITYPTSGSIYNWQANFQYQVGQIIIDSNGHVQKVTTSTAIGHPYGLSSMSGPPSFSTSGGYTSDNQLRWQDEGLLNFGPYLNGTYTFVSTIDNTQWGQVLIGATLWETASNLIDAINQNILTQCVAYSLPTWENPLVSANVQALSLVMSHPPAILPGQWQANSQAVTGTFATTIIDTNGNVQKATSITGSGTSGTSAPSSWNLTVGGTTTDAQITWTNEGPNISFNLCNKVPGSAFIASITATTTGSVLKFTIPPSYSSPSASVSTAGGYTGNGPSYNPPGTGTSTNGTTSIAFGNANAQVTGVSFTPGSNVTTLWSPLNSGGPNLCLSYYRVDSDLVGVENTSLVTAQAAIEHGTGKYQAYSSAEDLQQGGAGQALLFAQQALAAFDQVPTTLQLITLRPGLATNQGVLINFNFPYGPSIQQLSGPTIATTPVLGGRLIVPPNDGNQRIFTTNWEDLLYPDASGGPSFGNGTVGIKFDGAGNCWMNYQGVTHFTLYARGFGTNGTQYLHAGPAGAITGTGAIPGSTAWIPVASGDVPLIGTEMQIQLFSSSGPVYTLVTGPAVNNPDKCIHAYLTGPLCGWVIQEIEGELMPALTPLQDPFVTGGYGFWKYTVHCVNVAQIGSFLDFWLGLGGGGGGQISSTPVFAGGTNATGTQLPSDGGSSSGYITIEANGSTKPQETILQFLNGTNTSVTAVDDSSNSSTDVTINSALTVTHNGSAVGTEPTLELEDGANVTLTITDDPTNTRVKVSIAASVTGVITDLIHSYSAPPASGSWTWVPGSQGSATLGLALDLTAPIDSAAKYMRMVYVALTGAPYTVIGALCGFILDPSAAGFGIFVGGVTPVTTLWASSTAYIVGTQILDSNGNIQQVSTAGTSGSGSHPTWNTAIGVTTADGSGTLVWTCEGPATAFVVVENQINRWDVRYQYNYQYNKNSPLTIGSNVTQQTVWFKIQDDGTTFITISISQFNTDWIKIFQAARTAFLSTTANVAGFMVQAGASYQATATLSSWQITYP